MSSIFPKNLIELSLLFSFSPMVFHGSALANEPASTKPEKPTVKFYMPEDVGPMTREDSSSLKNGMSVHRRVISKPKDGSVLMDVGYNSFKAGAGSDKPYAYSKDELCYVASGEIYAQSEGKEVFARAGDFMWRPAGAATHQTKVLKDAVTICAFAPARDDEWSHRLPQSEIGKWDGDPEKKPHVIFRNYKDVQPMTRPGSPDYSDGRVVHRRIFTKQRDGAVYIDASHNFYKEGKETGPYSYTHDEVCWLESGEIEVTNDGVTHIVRTNEFMWRPAGAKTNHAKILKDSVSICFFAPARDDEWSHIVSAASGGE
ncbi:hypothetical protein [Sphingobium sp.]|uniref:cupin domain-containing protein n=1 Tax=Sphingobium sp. TaxID=1912891 RepID=UPI0028BF185C|nr:hypothetical protein [Sphingobium sp.]